MLPAPTSGTAQHPPCTADPGGTGAHRARERCGTCHIGSLLRRTSEFRGSSLGPPIAGATVHLPICFESTYHPIFTTNHFPSSETAGEASTPEGMARSD